MVSTFSKSFLTLLHTYLQRAPHQQILLYYFESLEGNKEINCGLFYGVISCISRHYEQLIFTRVAFVQCDVLDCDENYIKKVGERREGVKKVCSSYPCKCLSTIWTMACWMFFCSAVRLSSISFSYFLARFLTIRSESEISSPFSSTKGRKPRLLLSFPL